MECKPIIKHQEGLMVGKYSAWGEGLQCRIKEIISQGLGELFSNLLSRAWVLGFRNYFSRTGQKIFCKGWGTIGA